MTGFKGKVGAGYLLPALMLLTIILSATIPAAANDGVSEEAPVWHEVTVLYTSDVKGKVDPCG